MTKGPNLASLFVRMIITIVLVSFFPSFACGQLYSEFIFPYNLLSSTNQIYSYFPESSFFPYNNYPAPTNYYPTATNFLTRGYNNTYAPLNIFSNSTAQNIYAFPISMPVSMPVARDTNSSPYNLYYAAANKYYAAAYSNAAGTWVGRLAKNYDRLTNSSDSGVGMAGDNQRTYAINLNLAQYEGFVSGIVAITEGVAPTVINVDGALSGNQFSLSGQVVTGTYANNYQFKANATILGESIRGSYTINDLSLRTTIEVGSFSVQKQIAPTL